MSQSRFPSSQQPVPIQRENQSQRQPIHDCSDLPTSHPSKETKANSQLVHFERRGGFPTRCSQQVKNQNKLKEMTNQFGVSAEERILALVGDIFLQSHKSGIIERLLELPARVVGHTNVSNFARSHQVAVGTQGLLEGSSSIPTVRLIQVNVASIQIAERALHGFDDVAAREPNVIVASTNGPTD
jgi:hypothetical protein